MRTTCLLFLFIFLQLSLSNRDFYNILGVDSSASIKEIKAAYRKLAKENHPDRNKDDPQNNIKMRDINDAYKTLVDPAKKEKYDKFGENAPSEESTGFHPFGRFFNDMFGGSSEEEEEEVRGGDIIVDLFMRLEDLYTGVFIDLIRRKPVKKSASGTRKCNCRMEMKTTSLGPGRFQMSQVKVCSECPNVQFVSEDRELEIEIEPGMRDGHVYPFPMEGEPHSDGQPGDLKYIIREIPHEIFVRKGNDLYANVTVSLVDALVGFEYTLKHLDGHMIKITREQVTWPGMVVRKPGEGMPVYERSQARGILYIKFDVAFPHDRTLTMEDKNAIRQIFGTSTAV